MQQNHSGVILEQKKIDTLTVHCMAVTVSPAMRDIRHAPSPSRPAARLLGYTTSSRGKKTRH